MYNRVNDLKNMLKQIPEFQEAIYDEGILRDLRFNFSYQNEIFVLIYKFDYSNPRLYRKKKDGYLHEIKKYIIPKEIKQKTEEITKKIKTVNDTYYPFIPNDVMNIGNISFKTKFLNEYVERQKFIDYIAVTIEMIENNTKINTLELGIIKKENKWEIDKDVSDSNIEYTKKQMYVSLLQKELLKKLQGFETDIKIVEVVDLFLKRTE